MIYTVTLNPALDYVVGVDNLKIGETNRTNSDFLTFGGKGLNVSAVLCALGTPNKALGFFGGFIGREILHRAEQSGIECDFIELPEQNSRINIKIETENETEINAAGPEVSKEAQSALYKKLSTLLPGDILVLSGSIPKSLSPSFYTDIMTRLPKGVKTVVDAAGITLKNTLSCHPFLIKPDAAELGDIYGATIAVKTDAVFYGKKLIDAGAENVLVSMGARGAVLITAKGEVYEMDAPDGEVVNRIGTGCSMIAGFLSEYTKSGDFIASLRMAVCAGSATAFSSDLADKDEILRIVDEETK